MKLYELLSITSEYSLISIRDNDTTMLLAKYDGKNSIPEKYFDFEVTKIEHDILYIDKNNKPKYAICYFIKTYKLEYFEED